jgi:hypothetical protein
MRESSVCKHPPSRATNRSKLERDTRRCQATSYITKDCHEEKESHQTTNLKFGFTHLPRGPVPDRRPAPQSPIARMHDPNPPPGNLAARRVRGHDIFPPILPAHIMWTVFQSGSEIVSPLAAMIVWLKRRAKIAGELAGIPAGMAWAIWPR